MANIFTTSFVGTNGASWGAEWTIGPDGTGTVDKQSNLGHQGTGTINYGKAGAYNTTALSSNDYTLSASLKIPAAYTEWYAMIHIRGDAVLNNTYQLLHSYQYRYKGGTWGYIVPELYEVDGTGTESLISSSANGYTYDPLVNETIDIKIQVSGSGPVTLSHKEWKHGNTEPAYGNDSSNIITAFNGAYFALSVQGGGDDTTSDDFYWSGVSVDTASANQPTAKRWGGIPFSGVGRRGVW